MQASNMKMKNISQKPSKIQISNACGLLIVSPQSFANFIADTTNQKYINIAMSAGFQAAKKTSEMFSLCYQISLQHIDITIQPTDSIHTDTLQYYTNTLPSFNLKSFHFTRDNKDINIAQPKEETPTDMRSRFNKATIQFQNSQVIKNTNTKPINKPQEQCGFEAKVSIQANAQIPPNMESMNAIHAVLLSLFGKFSNDDMAVIAQIRLV